VGYTSHYVGNVFDQVTECNYIFQLNDDFQYTLVD